MDLSKLRKDAEDGDAEAQYELATRLRRGEGVETDLPQAFAWMQRAADQGLPRALAYVGFHHLNGYGTQVDAVEAVKWLRRGVEADDDAAHYYLALCLRDGCGVEEDRALAFHHWSVAAKRDRNGSALFEVARCLEAGDGVAEDLEAARATYQKAMEAGSLVAKASLGFMLLEGTGGEQEIERGASLVREADAQGDSYAPAVLGDHHREGRHGFARDLAAAEACYVRAAERGGARGIRQLRRHFPGRHLELVGHSYDLQQTFDVGVPLLVDVEREWTIRGQVLVIAPGIEQRHRLDDEPRSRLRLVDEFQSLGESWSAKRRVVTSHRTSHGEVDDDELNGAELLIRSDPGRAVEFSLAGGRLARQSLLDEWQREAGGAGVDLRLPREAILGERFKVDAGEVLRLLVDSSGTLERFELELELVHFDPDRLEARLAGRGTARERVERKIEWRFDAVLDQTTEREFTLDVVLDLASRTVLSIDLVGTGKVSAQGRFGVAGVQLTTDATLEFKARLWTCGGAAAIAARMETPVFRDVVRELDEAGLKAVLPSHFFDASEDGETRLVSALGDGRMVTLSFETIALGDRTREQAIAELEADLVKQAGGATVVNDVECGLGRGRGAAFLQDGDHVEIEIYSLGADRLLRLRVRGAESAKAQLRDELARFRQSLIPRFDDPNDRE